MESDKSRSLHASRSVLKLESETRLAIVLILTLRRHSGFRVTVTGQVQSGDELPSPTQDQFHPVPADLQIALAPKPMRVDPAAFALVDHLGALGTEIQRRDSQHQAETRQGFGRTNEGRFQLKAIGFIV